MSDLEGLTGTLADLPQRPVWGALESNRASRGLAASLGFEPVDRLWVFQSSDGKASG